MSDILTREQVTRTIALLGDHARRGWPWRKEEVLLLHHDAAIRVQLEAYAQFQVRLKEIMKEELG